MKTKIRVFVHLRNGKRYDGDPIELTADELRDSLEVLTYMRRAESIKITVGNVHAFFHPDVIEHVEMEVLEEPK